MRLLRHAIVTLLTACFTAVLVTACNGGVLHPPVGPGTDYPCGLQGKSCGNHMCCWLDEDCGGGPFNGCPAGYCCYNGGDDTNMTRKPEHQMLDYDMLNGKVVHDSK